MKTYERIRTLDALRALASLSVAWFHLSFSMGLVPKGTALYRSGTYGWVGVEAFFVISGFVIPYSLDRGGYRVRSYGRFILKRIIRLDPPYLITILGILVIAAHYSHIYRTPFPFSVPQLLLHLGYLNVIAGYEWIDPVFWTLAIEFQYYVLIGLVFPLVRNPRRFWLIVVPVSLVLALTVHNDAYIFRYLPFFLLGIVAFHQRRGALRTVWFVASSCIFAYFGCRTVGLAPAIVALTSGFAIVFVTWVPRPLSAFGSISYSLYLVHASIGYTIASEAQRRIPNLSTGASVLLGVAASISAAYLLYRLVELPSRRFSSRIPYSRALLANSVSGIT